MDCESFTNKKDPLAGVCKKVKKTKSIKDIRKITDQQAGAYWICSPKNILKDSSNLEKGSSKTSDKKSLC